MTRKPRKPARHRSPKATKPKRVLAPKRRQEVILDEDAPCPIEALRIVEHLHPDEAARIVQRAYDDDSVNKAVLTPMGIYKLPADDFDGLEWPAFILDATRYIGDRVVTKLVFAVYAQVDGDLAVTPLSKVPDPENLIKKA